VTDKNDDVEDERYRYQIRMAIRHPTMRLDDMSSQLNCEPTSGWNVGDRIGPRSPLRRFSAWRLEREFEDRAFFKGVKDLCEWAMQRKEAIHALRSDGASAVIIVNLRGQFNIGDVLDCDTMRMATELNIPISLEVFPDTNW
jgi:hypothetical protein